MRDLTTSAFWVKEISFFSTDLKDTQGQSFSKPVKDSKVVLRGRILPKRNPGVCLLLGVNF